MKYQIILLSSFFISSLFAMEKMEIENDIHTEMLSAIKDSQSEFVKSYIKEKKTLMSLGQVNEWLTVSEKKKENIEKLFAQRYRSWFLKIALPSVVISAGATLAFLVVCAASPDNTKVCNMSNDLSLINYGINAVTVLSVIHHGVSQAQLPEVKIYSLLQQLKKEKESEAPLITLEDTPEDNSMA